MITRFTTALAVLLAATCAPPALAQRGGRRGFNLGISTDTEHPSLFLHPKKTTVARLKVGEAKRIVSLEDAGDGLLPLALKYLFEGDSAAAEKVIAALVGSQVPKDFDLLGPWLIEYSLAYDWVVGYGKLDTDDHKLIVKQIEAGIEKAMWLVGQTSLGPQFAEYVDALCSAGVASLALHTGQGGIKRHRKIHDLFMGKVVPMQIKLGGRPAGPWKGIHRAIAPALIYAWAYSSVFNTNFVAELDAKGRGWVSRGGQWIIQSTLPDGSLVRMGDAPKRSTTRDGLRMLFMLYEQLFGDIRFSQYKTRLKSWWGKELDKGAKWPVLAEIWQTRRLPRARPHRATLGEMFGKDALGHYFGRGDTEGTVRVRLNAGKFWYPEQHRDQGSFAIYRQGPLAIDQGWTAGKGVTDALKAYARSSAAHNVMRLIPPGGGDGEQAIGKTTTGGRIKYFRSQREGDIVWADLTGAYPQKGLTSYNRQLVFLRPGTIVVLDAVKTSKPGWQLVWQLQTEVKPELEAEKPWVLERLGSVLRVTPFGPVKLARAAVASNVEVPAEPKPGSKATAETDAPTEKQDFWRTEFTATSDKTQTVLLFVLQVHAKDKPLPEPTFADKGGRLVVSVGRDVVELSADGRRAPRIK